jgi:hypothetical protein
MNDDFPKTQSAAVDTAAVASGGSPSGGAAGDAMPHALTAEDLAAAQRRFNLSMLHSMDAMAAHIRSLDAQVAYLTHCQIAQQTLLSEQQNELNQFREASQASVPPQDEHDNQPEEEHASQPLADEISILRETVERLQQKLASSDERTSGKNRCRTGAARIG